MDNQTTKDKNIDLGIDSPSEPIELVSKEQLMSAMPGKLKLRITDDFVKLYNDSITATDSELVYAFKENFISYSKILEEGKYSTEQYLNAVKYVSFKLMSFTNRDSYKMTFPERFNRLMKRYRDLGFDDAFIWDYKISPHVVSYNGGTLVQKIMEQTIIPPHVLNMNMYQDALNVNAHLMVHAKSEMVRTTAANSILTQLKPPEVSKIEIDVSVKESDAIKDLRSITQDLAIAQQKAIEAGANTPLEIAESKIIEAEIEEKE